MNTEPEALRLANALRDGTYLLSVERDATEAALREQHAEIERLKAERDGFYMDYRMKSDEETKAQAVEIERLTAKNETLRDALARYGIHGADCIPHENCKCGLDAALRQEQHAEIERLRTENTVIVLENERLMRQIYDGAIRARRER